MEKLTPAEVKRLRARLDWSLQDLALHSGVNKAYLSEFEGGKRRLSDEMLEKIDVALRPPVAGNARPELFNDGGHNRLHFVDANGNETARPTLAYLKWVEADGTAYTMFVGDRDA